VFFLYLSLENERVIRGTFFAFASSLFSILAIGPAPSFLPSQEGNSPFFSLSWKETPMYTPAGSSAASVLVPYFLPPQDEERASRIRIRHSFSSFLVEPSTGMSAGFPMRFLPLKRL